MNLPETWIQTTVGTIVDDIQPGFAQKPGEEDAGTTPQIRTHNVTPDGQISLEGIKHITASKRELDRYSLSVGDVIFNNTNSEEWVGKTAVFNQEGEYVFSNHMTRLRARHHLISPEYLASYLHLLWSMGYSKTRAKRWVSQAGIESDTLASFKIRLPTLPEQQRIVEVMRQSNAIPAQKLRRKQLDSMIKSALDRLVLARPESQWEQLGTFVETRYGTSVSADSTAQSGVAVLRIPNVMGGEIDTEDLKYVDLSEAELERLSLTSADVLIVRSNGNPEYVGRSAPITEDVAKSAMVFASYLIRLRTDTTHLLPEYLSAFLNSAYGRAAMRNAIRTTAGQSNLSGENLTRVKLPIPSIAEQETFRDFWLDLRELRRFIARSESIENKLSDELIVQALSGELTATWRDNHAAEVAEAVRTRDALLRERGTNNSLRSTFSIRVTAQADLSVRRGRRWLLGELSNFQRQVLSAFIGYQAQPLLAEDADVFGRFCDDEKVSGQLERFGPSHNQIRRTLSQLSALGLIAKVTLPMPDSLTGEVEYLKAFRPLRDVERTRLGDVEMMNRFLLSNEPIQTHYFTVQKDSETSEHAGAGGMFQVISLTDQDEKDATNLVDVGKHYASLEELGRDIAKRLGVPENKVEVSE